jgi:hypothetical protein
MNDKNEPQAVDETPKPIEDNADDADGDWFSFAPGTESIDDGNGFADNALTTGGKLG